MNVAMWLAAAVNLTSLNVGDPTPKNVGATNELLRITTNELCNRLTWVDEGVDYDLCGDDVGYVQYISTKSDKVATPEGARVGMSFSSVVALDGSQTELWFDMPLMVKLPSGWRAVFRHWDDKSPDGATPVVYLFKGKTGGYGARPEKME